MTYDQSDHLDKDTALPWKVYYDGNLWGHSGKDRPGTEIFVGKQFVWDSRSWRIPAIYSAGKGMVVDFCVQASAEQIQAYLEKWSLSPEQCGSDFTEEQQMQMKADNPLSVDFTARLLLNGKTLQASSSCGSSWIPCFPERNGSEMYAALEHYGLDPTCGWTLHRVVFPWITKRKPQIRTLSLQLSPNPTAIPSIRFHACTPGEQVVFTHPLTDVQYTLTVQACEQHEVSSAIFGEEEYEHPTHFTSMSYTLSPDLATKRLMVRDCSQGDHSRQKHSSPSAPQTKSACSIGIIGGSHGPTSIVLGDDSQGKFYTVCSALHFQPVETVEWRIVFHEKLGTELTVSLVE